MSSIWKNAMKGKRKVYHLCNLSQKVIFRNKEDYYNAINRLAACAYEASTEVWAYAIMSTHLHLIVKTDDIDKFTKAFCQTISRTINHKYNSHIRVSLSKRALNDKGEILTAVNYVLKNPMHHQVAEVAFTYPYSSAYLYFRDKIRMEDSLLCPAWMVTPQRPSEIGTRVYRKLFGKHVLPEKYLITNGVVIQPESFVNVRIIEMLYESVRSFLYNMNKPLKEELEMFGQNTEFDNYSDSAVSLFGKLTDIKVCEIIDDYVSPRPYTQMTSEERIKITAILHKKSVSIYQIERCLQDNCPIMASKTIYFAFVDIKYLKYGRD